MVCLALHRCAAQLIIHLRFLGAEVSFCHTYLQGDHMDYVTHITASLFLICQKDSDLPAGKFRSLSIFPISLPEWNDLTGGTEVYDSTYSLFMRISDHPAVAFWIFCLWVHSTSIFQSSDKEYILFSLTPGMQKHNKHFSVKSITIPCIFLPFVYSGAKNV